MIVVADTSPINYLILLGRVEILPYLYKRIAMPHAVVEELCAFGAPPKVHAWAKNLPLWVEVLSPSGRIMPTIGGLDRGETEAIALAEELRVDWLILDELAGRDEAFRRGIPTIGTVGVLRDAHRADILDLRVVLPQLRLMGFYLSERLLSELLKSI